MSLEAALKRCGTCEAVFEEVKRLPNELLHVLLHAFWNHYRFNEVKEAPYFVKNIERGLGERTQRNVADPACLCGVVPQHVRAVCGYALCYGDGRSPR